MKAKPSQVRTQRKIYPSRLEVARVARATLLIDASKLRRRCQIVKRAGGDPGVYLGLLEQKVQAWNQDPSYRN